MKKNDNLKKILKYTKVGIPLLYMLQLFLMISKFESDLEINIDIDDQEIDANFIIMSMVTIFIYFHEK